MKKYDQCLSVSKNNYKYLSLSEKRAKGKLPEMEVAKAYTMFLKKKMHASILYNKQKQKKIINIGFL